MNPTRLTCISFLFIALCVLSACGDKESVDFRESLIGRYGGQATSQYYIFDPIDTSKTDAGENSIHREILVTLGDCEDCLALIYDTIQLDFEYSLVSDTINIPEDGIFQVRHQVVGASYFRNYQALFEKDSLHITLDWGSYNESYRYQFRGRKLSDF